MTPADTMRAAVEALETCKTGGYRDIDGDWAKTYWFNKEKIRSALSLLRSALEGGEPKRYRWDTDIDVMVGPVPDGEWVRWADIASIPPNTPVEAGKVGVADAVKEGS